MQYLGNTVVVASYGHEFMWLVAGVIAGMALMAVIDFIIDRTSNKEDLEND